MSLNLFPPGFVLEMSHIELPSDRSPQEFTSTDETSLLVIVLDCNPGQRIVRENPHFLSHCVDSVIAFANAHLMQKAQNKLAVMACNAKTRYFFINAYIRVIDVGMLALLKLMVIVF